MNASPSTLAELRRNNGAPRWLLNLVLPEIDGGRFTVADVASVEVPASATALRISGLDQASFESLVTQWGSRFRAIEFWKCPRIADLSPLEDLPHLRLVSFYWNQRATRLWDLRKTPKLAGLHFDDFTRLHDLVDLARGTSLVELEFGDAVWDTSVFDSSSRCPRSRVSGRWRSVPRRSRTGASNRWRRCGSWSPCPSPHVCSPLSRWHGFGRICQPPPTPSRAAATVRAAAGR